VRARAFEQLDLLFARVGSRNRASGVPSGKSNRRFQLKPPVVDPVPNPTKKMGSS